MKKHVVGCVLLVVTWVPSMSVAAPEQSPHLVNPFWYVNHPCVYHAATRYRLTPRILEAIVHVESKGNPYAVSVNEKGEGHSQGPLTYTEAKAVVQKLWKEGKNFDVGLTEINSIHMKTYRLDPVLLLDPCTNLYWGAFILRQKVNQFGEGWVAVGRYNGSRNVVGYSWKIFEALKVLDQVVHGKR